MKNLYYILLIFIVHINLFAQNLVPNPSFEDTIHCPEYNRTISYCANWKNVGQPISTPDYFKACGTNYPSVPVNQGGFQYALDGNSYAGIIGFQISPFDNGKELIGTTLIDTLIIGKKYYLSFYVSLTLQDDGEELGYACNKLGALFTTTEHDTANPVPVNNFAHIYSNQIITDSANWTKVSGSFVADQAYSTVNIGVFFDNNSIDTIKYRNNYGAYYYIDYVCVSEDSLTCNSLLNIKKYENKINNIKVEQILYQLIITNPSQTNKPLLFQLYNIEGKKVLEKELISNKTIIETSELTSGIYYIIVNNKTDSFKQKIVITK